MRTQDGSQPTPDASPELPRTASGSWAPTEILNPPEDIATATIDRSPLLEVSNAMVRLYKEAFGRGPTKARAQFVGPDTLLVTLESSLSVAERNLAAMGEHQRLREARLFLAYALEDQFRAIVEQALGRKTLAFVTGIDTSRDVTVKLFTLEPADEPSAPLLVPGY
jgi:uncharacterized protein YbcI